MGFLWLRAMCAGLWVPEWNVQHPFAYFFFLGFLTSLLPLSLLLAISAIILSSARDAMVHGPRPRRPGRRHAGGPPDQSAVRVRGIYPLQHVGHQHRKTLGTPTAGAARLPHQQFAGEICAHASGRRRFMPYDGRMAELVFEVVQEPDGGYCAECLTENIFTQGDTWEELRRNVVEATSAFFFDRERPELVRLHLVRDEILSVA
jgi:predicted RNase H-like HicB family nuclease